MCFISLTLLVIIWMQQFSLPVLQSPSTPTLLLNAFSSLLHPWHKRIWSGPAAFTSGIKERLEWGWVVGGEVGSKISSEPGGGFGECQPLWAETCKERCQDLLSWVWQGELNSLPVFSPCCLGTPKHAKTGQECCILVSCEWWWCDKHHICSFCFAQTRNSDKT